MKNKKQIKKYPDLHIIEYELMMQYRIHKRNKDFDKAFELLEYIEKNCYSFLRRFVAGVVINKERAILYRKLKSEDNALYYSVLSEVMGMVNMAFYSIRDSRMFSEFYFTKNFKFEDERVNRAVYEYVEWFKPVYTEMMLALGAIKIEIDETYLNYSYHSSRDLEEFIYSNNPHLLRIIKRIDSNPFSEYYKKHVFDVCI